MYIPKHFRQEDREEILKFIKMHSFATLVSFGDSYPTATHTPIELETNPDGETVLWGHIARANKQWRYLKKNPKVLVIFKASDSYISSSWYEEPEVPTWNYQAVHVYGKIKELPEDILRESLCRLMDKYEQHSECPVSMGGLPESVVEPQIKRIFGFEICIAKVEAADKLSQNRNKEDHANIISELKKKGDAQSRSIAEAMLKQKE
jgi:transcriptional regulator